MLIPGAEFSDCGNYRYTLTRCWDAALPNVFFCMLNPSTADESANDPTIERCQRRAQQLGYGSMVIINIFALRSTDPARLYEVKDPVGPYNDGYIFDALKYSTDHVICGWGAHGSFKDRGSEVLQLFKLLGKRPYALHTNQDGSPTHPLYIGYDVKPQLLTKLLKK